MSRFNGRTVIITGGATGIGLTTSEHFAAEGADVVMAGRSVKSASEPLLRLERYKERVHFIATDVSVEEDVKPVDRADDDAYRAGGRACQQCDDVL